jgi:FkbM family methyltransferase
MIEHIIKTSQGNKWEIVNEDADVIAYFSNPENQIETITKQISDEGMYNPIFANRSDMTVLDLGANCGLFSLYAADSCKRIVAVEAAPSTFDILQKLVKNQPVVEALNCAVAPANDDLTFYINENSTTNSLLDRKGTPVTVRGTTLANLLDSLAIDHVDFVKCDIEGSEMVALTEETVGAVADRVDFWFVEIHQTNVSEAPWPGNLGSNREQLANMFQRLGYQTEMVIHDQLFAWK